MEIIAEKCQRSRDENLRGSGELKKKEIIMRHWGKRVEERQRERERDRERDRDREIER